MKRFVAILIVLTMLLTLVACEDHKPRAHIEVRNMIEAIISGDYEKAEALINPQGLNYNSNFDEDWGSMCRMLKGKKIKKLEWQKFTSSESSNEFEESGNYKLKMSDGSTYEVTFNYLEKDSNCGFVDFHVHYSK